MNENMRTSLWLAVIELCFVLRCFLCMIFTPGSAFYNLSRAIRKTEKTVLVRTVFSVCYLHKPFPNFNSR
ncbi:hypothetical protein AR691_06035 [Bacillus amyloliquefaciens]|nr:hypothetical protein VK94_01545 [Bacillus sp. LK7]KTF61353.1 hypothetical protein AR691_06035 [Bacillus amyloliquefaciens]MBR8692716.1 hypothetical protein [Bacillus velezensis]